MKTNLFVMGAMMVLLIAAPLFMVGAWGNYGGQGPRAKDQYRLEGPFTQGNLSVFLIHGKDKIKGETFLTLQEALVQKEFVTADDRTVSRVARRRAFPFSRHETHRRPGIRIGVLRGGRERQAGDEFGVRRWSTLWR